MNSKFFFFAIAFLAGASITGCGGHLVGNGNGPDSLVITAQGNAAGASQARVYQCLLSQLSAQVYFDDGQSSNYTSRVVWTSSDAQVLEVSSTDAPISTSSGDSYAPGTVIPIGPGNALVTAYYEGLQSEIFMTVAEPGGFSIKRYLEDVYSPISSLLMGVDTDANVSVSILLDGVEQNASNIASWTVDGINPDIASVTGAGTYVTVHAAGTTPSPTNLTAHFPSCSNIVSIPLTTKYIQKLDSTLEFGPASLLVNNSERIFVYADFGDGTSQDISEQATLASPNNAIATLPAGSNLITGVSGGGPLAIQPSFLANNQELYAPYVYVAVANGSLVSFSISSDISSLIAGSDQVAQFTAQGVFSNGQTQDATRVVKWSSSNENLAEINSTGGNAGQATAGTAGVTGIGQVTITASPNNNGIAPNKSLLLNLVGP